MIILGLAGFALLAFLFLYHAITIKKLEKNLSELQSQFESGQNHNKLSSSNKIEELKLTISETLVKIEEKESQMSEILLRSEKCLHLLEKHIDHAQQIIPLLQRSSSGTEKEVGKNNLREKKLQVHELYTDGCRKEEICEKLQLSMAEVDLILRQVIS